LTITVKEMKIAEINTVAMGIPLIRLMEAAGKSVADTVIEHYPIREKEEIKVVILMGRGGNGGDSLVAARYLSSRCYRVEIIPAYREELINHPDTLENYKIVKNIPSIIIHKPGDTHPIHQADIIIDGLLGTGVRGELRDPIKSLVEESNKSSAKLRVAIDTPTGLNPDTGEIHGTVFKADITVTFHDIKPGLLKHPEITGKIIVANIGIPREALVYTGPGDVMFNLKERPRDAHKGQAGKIMIIGGSRKYTGAPALAGIAALAAGADLTFIVAPTSIRGIIASYSPELITLPYEGEELNENNVREVMKYVDELRPHVVVVGPGLGRSDETLKVVREVINTLIKKKIYVVIDADALKALTLDDNFEKYAVLTPHRGEFKSITGITLSGDPSKDLDIVIDAAKKLDAVVLLKAPIDIVTDGEKYKLNRTGNPYMSIGGTGDVLSGLTASFLAQTRNPYLAAVIAAYINGLAGDYLLKNNEHVSPVNMIRIIPKILKNPLEYHIKTYHE